LYSTGAGHSDPGEHRLMFPGVVDGHDHVVGDQVVARGPDLGAVASAFAPDADPDQVVIAERRGKPVDPVVGDRPAIAARVGDALGGVGDRQAIDRDVVGHSREHTRWEPGVWVVDDGERADAGAVGVAPGIDEEGDVVPEGGRAADDPGGVATPLEVDRLGDLGALVVAGADQDVCPRAGAVDRQLDLVDDSGIVGDMDGLAGRLLRRQDLRGGPEPGRRDGEHDRAGQCEQAPHQHPSRDASPRGGSVSPVARHGPVWRPWVRTVRQHSPPVTA